MTSLGGSALPVRQNNFLVDGINFLGGTILGWTPFQTTEERQAEADLAHWEAGETRRKEREAKQTELEEAAMVQAQGDVDLLHAIEQGEIDPNTSERFQELIADGLVNVRQAVPAPPARDPGQMVLIGSLVLVAGLGVWVALR